MPAPIDFNFAPVPALQFWITLAAGIVITFILIMYLTIFVWIFGKPMRRYLSDKLKGHGIIQMYEHDTVTLRSAIFKDSEFIDLEGNVTELVEIKKKWYQFWIRKPVFKTVSRKQRPIVAKSIISINGVPTIMVWNVNPSLPERYLAMLEFFKDIDINSIDEVTESWDLTDVITNKGHSMTVLEFLDLHKKIKDKNEIIVTPDDILSFSKKYLDEHSKKSVIEKEVTIMQKRATDKKYQTYAFYIVALMVIGGFIILGWKMYNGTGATP